MPETESPTTLSRIELLQLAQSLGVSDADVMTRAELRAAIENAKAPPPPRSEQSKTWVGVARRLLASVIERGLNLPDAAALVRGDAKLSTPPKAPPPVATVTLARIYAAQGHVDRALVTLDEVLESDPDHELARDLRAQLELRRQENLAREADAAPSVRPADDELTPIMPEVALREAAERGAPVPGRIDGADGLDTAGLRASEAAAQPQLEPQPASTELAGTEAPASAPASAEIAAAPEAAGELVAPAFAVAERVEPTHLVAEEPPAPAPLTHDSETPPAPSVFSVAEPEVEGYARLDAEVDVGGVPPDEANGPTDPSGAASLLPSDERVHVAPTLAAAPSELLSASELESPPTGAEPPVVEPARPAAHGLANGIAPSAAHASAGSPGAQPPEPPRAAPETAAPEAALPTTPGLLLIEVERRERYLYWELGAASAGPCWLHVVSHTPAPDGHAERHERRFPVQQRSGALRLEGLPAAAVVRAKLSQDPDGRPVAVAGSVRSRDAGVEVRFCPHPRAALAAIAERARPALDRATPIYWDH